MKKRRDIKRGFTLVELMVAMGSGLIVLLAVALVLGDNSRGYQQVFNNTNSKIMADMYGAQRAFDRWVRKSSANLPIAAPGSTLDVYFISSPSYAAIDRRANFSVSGGSLLLKIYNYPGGVQQGSTQTICGGVSSCVFKKVGRSAQMILTLVDNTLKPPKTITTVTSAYVHN